MLQINSLVVGGPPEYILGQDENVDIERWIELGCPHIWKTVESHNGFVGQFDTGCGYIRILSPQGCELGRTSGYLLTVSGCVMLRKDYCKCDKYLWF